MQSFSDIWDIVLSEMKKEYSETFIQLWFSELELALLTDKAAIFISKSNFKREMLDKKYKHILSKYLKIILEFDVDIIVLSSENGPVNLEMYTGENVTTRDLPKAQPEETDYYSTSSHDTTYNETPLQFINPDFTFENFIVGSSNKFAHAACLAVANNPAKSAKEYNPLFLYGPSGLGKTHLLYAITNRIYQNDPQANIIYVKGEEFTNQMIESIAKKNTSAFREKFRKASVLLIDDIQFIAGKESTQEEFFHTFNALYEEGKQIIMTSDRPPRDIKTLEDRLKTRFEWGLITDIQPPNLELRVAIMKNKAEKLGLSIPNEILTFLAENLKSNVRQLEGAIKKIVAQSFLNGVPITLDLATTCVSDMISDTPSAAVTIDKIFNVISQKYGFSIDDLKGRKKTRDVANARHICIYLIRKLTDMSLPQIGKLFSRDHTTVMNSISCVSDEIKINSLYEIEINDLIREIKE